MEEEHGAGVYLDEVLMVEPHGIEPIAESERHGRPRSLFTLWFSANVEFATLVTGALAVGLFGLGFWQSVAALTLGTVIGAAFLGLLTTFGYRWGVPQLIQSRAALGFTGNFVPALLTFIAGVGWYAVNTVLGVFALNWLLPIGFLPNLLLLVVLQAAVSLYGYNLIHWVEKVSALLLALVFLVISGDAIGRIHYGMGLNPKAPVFSGWSGSFILTVGVALSYMMGWMIYASDYSRYLPSRTDPRIPFHAAFWSNLISAVWLEVLGAGLATIATVAVPTNLVTGLLPHPLAILAMLAVILGTVTANVLNIYSGALSLLAVDTSLIRRLAPRRSVAVLVVSVLGALLSYLGASGYYQNYENFLLILSYWVSPWLAVTVVDFTLIRKGGYRVEDFYERTPPVRSGFAAFLIGFLCSIPFFNQALFTGPVAKAFPGLGDISYYVGFLVAGGLHLLWGRRQRSADRTPAQAADAG